jgi:hypothetical protein
MPGQALNSLAFDFRSLFRALLGRFSSGLTVMAISFARRPSSHPSIEGLELDDAIIEDHFFAESCSAVYVGSLTTC